MTSGSATGPTGTASTQADPKERAKQVGGTAADEGKHVSEVAKEEASHVTSEAREQASKVIEDAKAEINEQSRQQCDRIAKELRTFSDQLRKMAAGSESSGTAAKVAQEVADRTGNLSSRIEGREPAQLLEEVRTFARSRPGSFLVGAAVAGLVAGRLGRSAKAGSSQGESTSPSAQGAGAQVTPGAGGIPAQPPPSATPAAGAPRPPEHPSR